MSRLPYFILPVLAILANTSYASTDGPDSALRKAVKVSSLIGNGAQPFHLKLDISEPSNPNSPYSATVEEYWRSSKDWYRSISSSEFKEIVDVNDGKRTEKVVGDYNPIWLRNFLLAATDPLQNSSFSEQVSA